MNDDALFEEFKSFERLLSARVVTDQNTGRSRGFGYVDFADGDAAQVAYEAKKSAELDGRVMNIDFAAPKADKKDNGGENSSPGFRSNERAKKYGDVPSEPSDTLFVGNIPWEADEESISEFFEELCKIKSLRLPTDM